MLKLIFKNLWAHRSHNLWVFFELVLISAVAWFAIEPVVVKKYSLDRDPGYDIDRLVHIELALKPSEETYSREERYDDLTRLLDRVRTYPQVESATIVNHRCFENSSLSVNSLPSDSVEGCCAEITFYPGTDFFRTFGIRTSGGKNDGQVFDEPVCKENDIIISRSVAEILHPQINPIDHYLNEHSENMQHGCDQRIVGIVQDAVYRTSLGRTPLIYKSLTPKQVIKEMSGIGRHAIVARMKPGVSPADFIRQHADAINTELSSGLIYAHSPKTYVEKRDMMALNMTHSMTINVALLAFLIVNLCLGVIGTFYLQTRDRSHDAGIMRAFGATRSKICRNLITEGWLMATLSWAISCLGAWMIAKKYGLTPISDDELFSTTDIINALPLWVDNLAMHFWIISAIVLVVLLITVTIGVYIPARRIADISPVDALRENN